MHRKNASQSNQKSRRKHKVQVERGKREIYRIGSVNDAALFMTTEAPTEDEHEQNIEYIKREKEPGTQ